jgi:plastocyanin
MPVRSRHLVIASMAAVAACGGGDSTAPPAPGPPASVSVAFADTLVLGDSARATATVRDAKGNALSGTAVAWRSSADNVLGVNAATGMVTGRALDTASVIATVSGTTVTGAARVRVRPPARYTVSMLPNSFIPVSFVLAIGGTVTFDFPPGIDHNVIFAPTPGAPQDIPQTRNVKLTRTFTRAGTFAYDCRIHPGMTGEVIVVP